MVAGAGYAEFYTQTETLLIDLTNCVRSAGNWLRSMSSSQEMSWSVSSAELAVVPADHLLRNDLEHHALRRAGQRSRLDRRRTRLRPRPRLERRPDAGFVLEDIAAPPDHHAPKFGVLVAGLDHQRHLRIPADVDDFLRLPVRGHVECAVPREVVHGHDMGEAVLVDGGQGRFLAFPEERGLLVGAQPDLLSSVGRHSCPSPLTRASARTAGNPIP